MHYERERDTIKSIEGYTITGTTLVNGYVNIYGRKSGSGQEIKMILQVVAQGMYDGNGNLFADVVD